MRYIPEIDGLRAVAVMSVIFYHFGVPVFSGGFIGVDVFFVISGYLITSILLTETKKNIFEFFKGFYIRRALRIFPALFFVIFVTMALSYFILIPGDYSELGMSAISAVAFMSNIYFYLNTGYFDGPAELMPLLHTWSLGVEEQFYLIWPGLILVLSRSSIRLRVSIVALLFVSSLLGSVLLTGKNISLTFYNLPFRIFEFLLGAVIPIFINYSKVRRICRNNIALFFQFIGILLILFSMINFSNEDSFPGYLALIPSLGSAIFIFGVIAASNNRFNPMGSLPMVCIGKISYSLYLWHWPVIVLFTIYNSELAPGVIQQTGLLLITFILSLISYYFIETPFRKSGRLSLSLKFSASLAILVIISSLVIISTKGVISRIPESQKVMTAKEMWQWDCPNRLKLPALSDKTLCNFGLPWKEASSRIILWGDSHAQQIAPLLEVLADEHNLSFLIYKACPPYVNGEDVLRRHKNPERATEGCRKSRDRGIEYAKKDPLVKLIIFSAAWRYSPAQVYSTIRIKPNEREALELMKTGMNETIKTLSSKDVDILVFGDIPIL
jgi:peptidoglycan/LPS O-acetylase OafA/YrhL